MAYRVSKTWRNPDRPFYCCALKNDKRAGCDCWMWAQGPARRARADADDLHGLASWGKVGGMTLGSFFGYEMPCEFDELDDDCYTDDD
jgi:hypothetical protein